MISWSMSSRTLAEGAEVHLAGQVENIKVQVTESLYQTTRLRKALRYVGVQVQIKQMKARRILI